MALWLLWAYKNVCGCCGLIDKGLLRLLLCYGHFGFMVVVAR